MLNVDTSQRSPSVETARALAHGLRSAGVEFACGMPGGGANLDLIGALEDEGVRFVLARSETAAVIIAGIVGEARGTPTVAVVTRGPGLASALNGMCHALLDRQPVIVVSDTVPTSSPTVTHQRIDQPGVGRVGAKATLRVSATTAAERAVEAVRLAGTAPRGPVHLDFDPSGSVEADEQIVATEAGRAGDAAEVRRRLSQARRPVVVVGVGARAHTGAVRRALAELDAPVLCTYRGAGVIPSSSTRYAGLATGGTIEGRLLARADLIVGIGLDPVELIPPDDRRWPPVVLLDEWDADALDHLGAIARIHGRLDGLVSLLEACTDLRWPDDAGESYRFDCDRLLAGRPEPDAGLAPQDVVAALRAAAPAGTAATVDAGAHMLVAMPMWQPEHPDELFVSSGLATMGFALPAAVAASIADPDQTVVAFTGDGGLSMAMGELETIARLRARVVVVVFNDATLSLIKIKQRSVGHGGEGAVSFAPVDYAAIAEGFGLVGRRVHTATELEQAATEAMTATGPSLLDVQVDPSNYPQILDVIRGEAGRTGRKTND